MTTFRIERDGNGNTNVQVFGELVLVVSGQRFTKVECDGRVNFARHVVDFEDLNDLQPADIFSGTVIHCEAPHKVYRVIVRPQMLIDLVLDGVINPMNIREQTEDQVTYLACGTIQIPLDNDETVSVFVECCDDSTYEQRGLEGPFGSVVPFAGYDEDYRRLHQAY